MGLIVDNFAGGGGASTGIEMALGRTVDIAINHDEAAIAMHKANHPTAIHYCQSVWRADPVDVTQGQPVDLAWFSPDCTHFSKARGGKPRKKHIRDLAWVVVLWAQRVKPDLIFLENVSEWLNWGPLDKYGRPIKEREGETFRKWLRAMKRAGYTVEWQVLKGCDFGDPTIRKRLFLIARRDNQPIVWPAPTHAPKGHGVKRHRTSAEIMDFSIPAPSIFSRKKELAENSKRRIARGTRRFVLEAEEPFIVVCNHGGDGFRGQDLKEPLHTVTASRDATGLVIPFVKHVQHSSAKNGTMSAEEPLRTVTAHPKGGGMGLVSAFVAKHYGGVTGTDIRNPFPTITTRGTQNVIVAAHLERQFGKSSGSDINEPMPTIMPGGSGKTALATSHLIKLRGTCKDGQPLEEPCPTVTAGGLHVGEVRGCLIKYSSTSEPSRSSLSLPHIVPSKGSSDFIRALTEIPACLTEEQRYNAWWVTRFLEDYEAIPKAEEFTERPSFIVLGDYILWDIGMRMLTPRELFRAQGFPENYIIDPIHNGKRLTKTEQVAKCGNSVCPGVVKALVEANFPDEKRLAA